MNIRSEFPNSRTLDLKDPNDVEMAFYFTKARLAIQAIPYEQRPHTVTHCIVCGVRCENCGVFLPTPEFQEKIGAPEGKVRLIPYGICNIHIADPASPDLVETMILRDLGDMGHHAL